MVFLFLLVALTILLAFLGCRKTAIGFLIASFILNLCMLWHHMTDTLGINW